MDTAYGLRVVHETLLDARNSPQRTCGIHT